MSAPQGIPQGFPAGAPGAPGAGGPPAGFPGAPGAGGPPTGFPPMPKIYFGPLEHYGAALSDALPDLKTQDIAADVAALRATFASGLTRSVPFRRGVLQSLKQLIEDNTDVLCQAMWKDLHKPPIDATMSELVASMSEIQSQIDNVEQWSTTQEAETNFLNLPGKSEIVREPFGVACVIATWNFPVNLLFMPLADAISAGNCVMVRLAGNDTVRHYNNVIIQLLDKYVDKRVVRYVHGGLEETDALLQHRFDVIFATGSQLIGKTVARAAAEFLTPTILELGGKNPAIVDATTDLDVAAKKIASGAFSNGGQLCVRPDYVLVDANLGDALVAKLQAEILQTFGDDPKASDMFGRAINARAWDRWNAIVQQDRAFIVHGGQVDAETKYVAPTLLNFKQDVEAFTASASMQKEIFGPLLPILYTPANDLKCCMDLVATYPKPLSLYLFSTSEDNKQAVIAQTISGGVTINDTVMQLTNNNLPFGGVGDSGMGVYLGRHGFRSFSHTKSILYK